MKRFLSDLWNIVKKHFVMEKFLPFAYVVGYFIVGINTEDKDNERIYLLICHLWLATLFVMEYVGDKINKLKEPTND